MRRRLLLVTPLYLLVIAYFVMLSILNIELQTQAVELASNKLATTGFIESLQPKKKIHEGTPNKLTIPGLALTLVVLDGTYDVSTQTWTLSPDKTHFAVQTNKLNNKDDGGLSLIYGHNNPKVLGSTKKLSSGDLMEIATAEGLTFIYKYDSDEVVTPENTSIFNYSGQPKLVLMSCTGTWNELRRLMYFSLVGVREG